MGKRHDKHRSDKHRSDKPLGVLDCETFRQFTILRLAGRMAEMRGSKPGTREYLETAMEAVDAAETEALEDMTPALAHDARLASLTNAYRDRLSRRNDDA